MQQIAWDNYVGLTTVHCIVKETCSDILSPIYLPIPNITEWQNIADGFHKRWNMPLCLGALDGKHIHIQAPKYSGSEYFNYKKTFSIVLMATCDAFYRFTFIDIGSYGSNHDSYVFKTSDFGTAIMEGKIQFPSNIKLAGQARLMPYFFVADQAFPLHNRLMRPYAGDKLGCKKNIFNYRLSRARRTIENSFGILAQRWRILRRPIIANVDNCQLMFQAIVCLHNYLQRSEQDMPINQRKYCPTGYVDYVDSEGKYHFGDWRREQQCLRSLGKLGSNNYSKNCQINRDTLADYFTSAEGSVPWQETYILRGSLPTNMEIC